MRREEMPVCSIRSSLFHGLNDRFRRLRSAPNSRSLALELTEIVELRAANATRLQDFDRTDHRGIDGENSLDTDSKADAPDRKCRPGKMAAPADHHSLKRLDALFFALGFLQPNVHTHGITGAEHGNILASLVLADLLNYATHMDSPGQTR
jgi:hypothetical protein